MTPDTLLIIVPLIIVSVVFGVIVGMWYQQVQTKPIVKPMVEQYAVQQAVPFVPPPKTERFGAISRPTTEQLEERKKSPDQKAEEEEWQRLFKSLGIAKD